MATLEELHGLAGSGDLINKVAAAIAIYAYDILQETTGTNLVARQEWAKGALASPHAEAEKQWIYVLAKNNASTVAQITNATDATIQTQLEEAIDKQHGAA